MRNYSTTMLNIENLRNGSTILYEWYQAIEMDDHLTNWTVIGQQHRKY